MALIIVSTEIDGEYVDVGDLLYTQGQHGAERVRFNYDADFVREGGWEIDPALRLDTGGHELTGLPLAIEDAAPDAWGEDLLQRTERAQALEDGRGARTLSKADFLIGASDATRQGALRFRTDQNGPFLSDKADVPQAIDIAELMEAAAEVEADPHSRNWAHVERLVGAGGSALGGARPKAAIVREDGRLWLAKFPRRNDKNNVPVWEAVGLDIAERAGLSVPRREIIRVGGLEVLLVQRFDRADDGQRLHYISARTLLGTRELRVTRDYAGRGGIAPRLRNESPNANSDLRRLWKQAALNLLINNTDNHLRNHGFLRVSGGWTLAPVFDLDPNPDTGDPFGTSVGGAVQRISGLPGLMRIARECGLNDSEARVALDEVYQAVKGWDEDARRHGATENEVALFEDAFTGLNEKVEQAITPVGSQARTTKKATNSQARGRTTKASTPGSFKRHEHSEADVHLTDESGDL